MNNLSCVAPEEYNLWLEAAKIAGPGGAGFCTDCTPEYAAKMRDAGKCDHPEIIFAHNGDGCRPTAYKLRQLLDGV